MKPCEGLGELKTFDTDCEALKLERRLCKGQVRTSSSGSPPLRGGTEGRLQRENTIRTQEGAPHPKPSLELFLDYPLLLLLLLLSRSSRATP